MTKDHPSSFEGCQQQQQHQEQQQSNLTTNNEDKTIKDNNNYYDDNNVLLRLFSPASAFAVTSIPLLYKAYQEYYRVPMISITESAEDGVRRAAASQIAIRALRVATYASVGVTTALTAVGLAYAGYTSLHDVWREARRTARQTWGPVLEYPSANDPNHHHHHHSHHRPGSLLRPPDRSHPDFVVTANMTEDEEMDYLARAYFPGQDWTQPDGKARQDQKDNDDDDKYGDNNKTM